MVNDNPPPGLYNPDLGYNHTIPRSSSAFVSRNSGYTVPRDTNPDAGQYNPDGGFGSGKLGNITMGSKYPSPTNDNPPPGLYNPDGGVTMTKSRSSSAFMRQGSGYKVARDDNPDAGDYNPFIKDHLGGVTMGRKYQTKYNDNPPPGYYNPEDGINMTHTKTVSTIIKPNIGFKVE